MSSRVFAKRAVSAGQRIKSSTMSSNSKSGWGGAGGGGQGGPKIFPFIRKAAARPTKGRTRPAVPNLIQFAKRCAAQRGWKFEETSALATCGRKAQQELLMSSARAEAGRFNAFASCGFCLFAQAA